MIGGGSGVIVCVLDDGVKPVSFLQGKAYDVNYSNKVGTTIRGTHGTAVASVVIDHCPEAIIYSYNIRDTDYTLDAINAALADILTRAKYDKQHRYIVNCSFAGDGDESNTLIAEMKRRMDLLVAANVPVVVGAGNDGKDVLAGKYPSCFQSPITASALNNDGTFARFSTWHNEVDFAELGVDVNILNFDGSPGKGDGTSFATPIVAAKCATLLSKYPTMTETELYTILKSNVLDLGTTGRDPYMGWGWIAALEIKETEPETPEEDDDTENEEEETNMGKIITLESPLMRGDDIKALQVALNALNYPCGTADGIAGSKTIAAIQSFCEAHGVKEIIEVPAELPESLTLSIEINGKAYCLDIKEVE